MQCIGSFVEASKFSDLHERSDVIELIVPWAGVTDFVIEEPVSLTVLLEVAM
jgi:hypothetical protein